MSFSSDWLALRAPADDRARDSGLRAEAVASVRDRRAPLIVDLGAGAGATWRALGTLGPPSAHWRLVDHDQSLLSEAQAAIGAGGADIRVETVAADLADPAALAAALKGADLVTASAFFDLVSADWIGAFVGALPPTAAVYAALTYDGREDWRPAAPEDAAALALFQADMRRDKGFGPALGGGACDALSAALRAAGRHVAQADSAWRLEAPRDTPLIQALAASTAEALARGAASPRPLDPQAWRRRPRASVLIGHCDHFAAPLAL